MSGWGIFVVDESDVHVAPVLEDECGEMVATGVCTSDHSLNVHEDHDLSRSCPCGPELLRDGPLDDPIWSHRQPDWPGSEPTVIH